MVPVPFDGRGLLRRPTLFLFWTVTLSPTIFIRICHYPNLFSEQTPRTDAMGPARAKQTKISHVRGGHISSRNNETPPHRLWLPDLNGGMIAALLVCSCIEELRQSFAKKRRASFPTTRRLSLAITISRSLLIWVPWLFPELLFMWSYSSLLGPNS